MKVLPKNISMGERTSWLTWLVPIGVGVLFLVVKLPIDRHAARQVARMNLAEAMSVDPKPQWAPVKTPVQADPEAELARLAAEGERRVHEANVARGDQIEWVRLERLCDAMQLLPEAYGPATVPTTAEFPAPGELVYGQENSTSAPPEPWLVAAAARKAVAERTWLASLPFSVTHYFAVLSASVGTDLEMVLWASGIETLVLAGIATSGVVLSTIRHAADADYRLVIAADYRLVIAADCCAAPDPEVHRVLTEKVFARPATVTSADAVIAALA